MRDDFSFLTHSTVLLRRSALGTGCSAVLLQPSGGAVLRVDSSPTDLSLPLGRLDRLPAQAEVKELVFGMAAHLSQASRQQGVCSSQEAQWWWWCGCTKKVCIVVRLSAAR